MLFFLNIVRVYEVETGGRCGRMAGDARCLQKGCLLGLNEINEVPGIGMSIRWISSVMYLHN